MADTDVYMSIVGDEDGSSTPPPVTTETALAYREEIKQLPRTEYTDLEWAVLNNSFREVEQQLENGSTLFLYRDGTCIRFCNGYLQRRGGTHGSKCKKKICTKTALYYALVNNCRAYLTIYKLLIRLQKEDPNLRPNTVLGKERPDCDPVSWVVNEVVEKFFSTKLGHADTYCVIYSEDSMEFKGVNQFLEPRIGVLKQLLTQLVVDERGGEVEDEDIDDFRLDPESTEESTEKSTEKSEKRTTPEFENDAEVILETIAGFSSDDIRMTQYIFFKDKATDISNLDLHRHLIKLILNTLDWYLENCRIVKLLFNEQAYEAYQNSLSKTRGEQKLIKMLKNLYRDDDPYIDINYTNPHQRHTALSMVTFIDDYPKLTEEIFRKGGAVKGRQNLVLVSLKKKYLEASRVLIDHAPPEILNQEIDQSTNLAYLIASPGFDQSTRIDLLKRMISRGVDLNQKAHDLHPLLIAIDSVDANEVVPLFFTQSCEVDGLGAAVVIPTDAVSRAIRKKNLVVLKSLLDSGAPVDGAPEHNGLHAIIDQSLTEDNFLTEVMNLLLKYDPDIDYRNRAYETALHRAASKGFVNSVRQLLGRDASPFLKDDEQRTPLVAAIENGHLSVIRHLVDSTNVSGEALVNVRGEEGLTPIMRTIEQSEALDMVKQLLSSNRVDLTMTDDQGRTVLEHIIERRHPQAQNLFRVLLPHIEIANLRTRDRIPILLAVASCAYDPVVIMMMNKMVEEQAIKIYQEGRKLTAVSHSIIRSMVPLRVDLVDSDRDNYFPLVITYLSGNYDLRRMETVKARKSRRSAVMFIWKRYLQLITYVLVVLKTRIRRRRKNQPLGSMLNEVY